MKIRNSLVWITALTCGLFAGNSICDEPNIDEAASERHLQLLDAESELKLHELDVAVSKHAMEEAEVEIGKAKANLRSVTMRAKSGNQDAKDRIEFATLEVRQAQVRAEMTRLQTEMKQVQLALAKARLEHQKVILSPAQKREPISVKFEIDDDLDEIIIRGSKEGVERLKSLIERSSQK